MQEKAMKQFNGYAFLVAVLREADPAFRDKLAKILREKLPLVLKLADEFEFIFQDIVRLDDRSIQKVFAVTDAKDWVVAWKLTSDPIKKILLRNMSAARQAEFLEEFQALPRMPRRQVVRIQMQLARKIQEMLQHGKLAMRARRFLNQK